MPPTGNIGRGCSGAESAQRCPINVPLILSSRIGLTKLPRFTKVPSEVVLCEVVLCEVEGWMGHDKPK